MEFNEEKFIWLFNFVLEEVMDMNFVCEILKEGKILFFIFRLFFLILKYVICLFYMLYCILFEFNMLIESIIFLWLVKKSVFESVVIFFVFLYRIICFRNK